MKTNQLYLDSFLLLEDLIRTPSFSKDESKTAALIRERISDYGISCEQLGNNVWCKSRFFDSSKPTLLLNSHHDTVRPNGKWTNDPFSPVMNGQKLYGLGSSDAGASLVSLLAAFRFFHASDLPFNLVFAATAEEEISGKGGIEMLWPHLPEIDFALVGEPTKMQVAVAEKGLLVLDCLAKGKSGHAARNEGENAITIAMKDIAWFHQHHFDRISKWLGPVKMSVTMINAGTQHNVVPAECTFTVDVRVNELYSMEEILSTISGNISSEVYPRSLRLHSSGISADHPLILNARHLGKTLFGSPTLSDQALIPVPSIKMGPGDSARSHTADEHIFLSELREGIEGYIEFITSLTQIYQHETLAENTGRK